MAEYTARAALAAALVYWRCKFVGAIDLSFLPLPHSEGEAVAAHVMDPQKGAGDIFDQDAADAVDICYTLHSLTSFASVAADVAA